MNVEGRIPTKISGKLEASQTAIFEAVEADDWDRAHRLMCAYNKTFCAWYEKEGKYGNQQDPKE